jgi:two-component system, NtrC family, sensor kinase
MFELTVIAGPDQGQIFRSRADEATIGRDESVEMVLTDRSSSRKHARVLKRRRYYELEDLKSGNGTILNAERITELTHLHNGDLILIGKNTIRFYYKAENDLSIAEETDYRTTATIKMSDLQRELVAKSEFSPKSDGLYRARTDMASIFRAGQSFVGLQTSDALYTRVVEVILAELPIADRASIILNEIDSTKPTIQITQARKNSIGITDTLCKQSLAHTALSQHQAMLIRDPSADERLVTSETNFNKSIRSAICVPIQIQSGASGVLYADCVTDSNGFEEADLKLLSVVGFQVAAALENARLYEQLNAEKAALAAVNVSIKQAQQRLVQSEKLAGVGELAAGIVHDIRNPIQLILGHAQYMQATIRDADAGLDKTELLESLAEIERGVGRVSDVVTQLLAFAKQSKPELRATRINDVALDTMRFLQPETNKNRVKVLTQFDPLMPPVLADPSQLKQVIVNIVINAVQSMPQGGTLTVTTAPFRDQDRDFVSLAFADTGCGMTPDQIQKIFDPFFTTKPGSTNSGSMGLGLAVSYGIIENHGGRIIVDSEPGRGSCFTLLLPAHNVPVIQQLDDPRATFHG